MQKKRDAGGYGKQRYRKRNENVGGIRNKIKEGG